MDCTAPLRAAAADGRALLAAAETGWNRPVPHCPEWDEAELVRHMGSILAWMAAIVTSRERVSRRTLAAAPEDVGSLPAWFLDQLQNTVATLSAADPDAESWTFSSTGDHRVAWWCRRLSVEIAIHRWDAEYAAGFATPTALDGDVAGAGIEEFIVEFLPGLLAAGSPGLPDTLHLHATDGPTEWSIDLAAGGTAEAQHTKADVAIRASRSDLLLWLTNRLPVNRLDVFGDIDSLTDWASLQR